MSDSEWRRVTRALRIECSEIDNKLNKCDRRAYACNVVHWETAGNKGVSFFYYCETHTRERRDKEERETVNVTPLVMPFS